MAAAVTQQEAQTAKDEDIAAFLEKHAEERRRQSEVDCSLKEQPEFAATLPSLIL